MSKILMINLPFSGHVNPTLPLTAELVKRGHKVDYICSEQFRDAIETAGADFIPYSSFPIKPTEREKKRLSFQVAFDTAGYIRLSREDGDKEESDSVGNQKKLLTEYISKHDDLVLRDFYIER